MNYDKLIFQVISILDSRIEELLNLGASPSTVLSSVVLSIRRMKELRALTNNNMINVKRAAMLSIPICTVHDDEFCNYVKIDDVESPPMLTGFTEFEKQLIKYKLNIPKPS